MQKCQGEVSACSFEPPRSDPVSERDAFGSQDPVQLPHRYVVCSGDTGGTEFWFLQILLDVLHDSHEESGPDRLLAQLDGVEMGRDCRPKQVNAGLTDHFAARAIKHSRARGKSVEVRDGHV